MGSFWLKAEAVFGLAVSFSQGGLGYRVYVSFKHGLCGSAYCQCAEQNHADELNKRWDAKSNVWSDD